MAICNGCTDSIATEWIEVILSALGYKVKYIGTVCIITITVIML
ncbi:MAG TPA: hypothetical protein VJ869_15470 [Sphaerochaeta sp.]|nr:hypothetical protein [Sphaerochaeta sp.]